MQGTQREDLTQVIRIEFEQEGKDSRRSEEMITRQYKRGHCKIQGVVA